MELLFVVLGGAILGLAARYAENWQAHAAHSVRPSGQ